MDLLQYKPKAQFAQRHLLTLQDYTPDEILQVLSLARQERRADLHQALHAHARLL